MMGTVNLPNAEQERTIKLLDGEVWSLPELITRMYEDDFYYNYLSTQKALSSTSSKDLFQAPKKFWLKHTGRYKSESKALNDGQLIHTMLLEPEKINERFAFADFPNKMGNRWKDFCAENEGKICMLESDISNFRYQEEQVMNNDEIQDILTGARPEVPGVSVINGIPFRGKADKLKSNLVIDIKTCRKEDFFNKDAKYAYHYDLQAALYRMIFNVDDFIIIGIGKEDNSVFIRDCSQEFYDSGMDKLQAAINTYNRFFKEGHLEEIGQWISRETL
jgi:hypothetical protein